MSALSWMARRRERRVFSLCEKHMSKVVECAESFYETLRFFMKCDREGFTKSYEKVSEHEREADKIKRQILDELASGNLDRVDREEVIKLIFAADDVAGYLRAACRRMFIFMESEGLCKPLLTLAPDVSTGFSKMSERLIEMVKEANAMIRSIVVNPREALDKSHDVERLEEEIDEVRLELLKTIISKWNVMHPVYIMWFKEIVDEIEQAADKTEELADSVRSIIIMGY